MARYGVWSHHTGNMGLVHRSGDFQYLLQLKLRQCVLQIDKGLHLVFIVITIFFVVVVAALVILNNIRSSTVASGTSENPSCTKVGF